MLARPTRFARWKETATSRVVAAALLLTIVLAISGLPQPVRKQIKPGERFPCESCACGCSSAAYCWDQCCCHSDLQKLAWADANGVKAPDFLVTRVALAKAEEIKLASKPACCRAKATTSCCASGKKASSCGDNQSVHDQPESAADDATEIRFLSFRAYAKCRGMNWVWTLLNQVNVKVVHPCDAIDCDPPLIAWQQMDDEVHRGLSLAPDPPVPWCV